MDQFMLTYDIDWIQHISVLPLLSVSEVLVKMWKTKISPHHGIIVVYWTGTFGHFRHFWALLWLRTLFYFKDFSTPCIMHNALGHSPRITNHIECMEQSEEVLDTPCLLHNKSSDIKWKQWWSTKPTKLHLRYQDVTLASQDGNWTRLVKKAMDKFIVLGMEWKAHLQGWQGHPNLVHPPKGT